MTTVVVELIDDFFPLSVSPAKCGQLTGLQVLTFVSDSRPIMNDDIPNVSVPLSFLTQSTTLQPANNQFNKKMLKS